MDRYRYLLRFGKLQDKAAEVNEEAYEMLYLLMEQYIEKNKPNQADSTIEMWMLREQAKMVVEETVFADIVYRFH